MKKVYLDNGSTSYPKAPGLGEAVSHFITEIGCNIGRGGYETAYDLGEKVYETRELLCEMFNFEQPKNVVFTPSVTYSLNYVIKGLVKEGDHIIFSSVDHNAVVRPCKQMESLGVFTDMAKCREDGTLNTEHFESLFKANTKLVVMTHSSNVSGTVQDAEAIGKICKDHGVYFVLDGAQTAGVVPIDFKKFNLSALCVTGHKSLLGPQGIGAMLLCDELAEQMEPIISGGTGSASDKLTMPEFMPDKFEAGTLNLPGIVGLNHSLSYIKEVGIDTIREKELNLACRFLQAVKELPGVRAVGMPGKESRVGIVSLDFQDIDNAEMSYILDEQYGIMTRCGLHCAPLAHQTFNTFPQGTVRFAFGHKNTEEDVDYAISSIKEILADN